MWQANLASLADQHQYRILHPPNEKRNVDTHAVPPLWLRIRRRKLLLVDILLGAIPTYSKTGPSCRWQSSVGTHLGMF